MKATSDVLNSPAVDVLCDLERARFDAAAGYVPLRTVARGAANEPELRAGDPCGIETSLLRSCESADDATE